MYDFSREKFGGYIDTRGTNMVGADNYKHQINIKIGIFHDNP